VSFGCFLYNCWLLYPWQCKICGLRDYPYGCQGHPKPPLDIELIHAMIWPHLPKGTTKIDRWPPSSAYFDDTKDNWPRIEVHRKCNGSDQTIGYVRFRNNVLTLSWSEAWLLAGKPPMIESRTETWNIADPNSTTQLVNKIKELKML
jgi:hypothetical protein